jgi:hypothetical protein
MNRWFPKPDRRALYHSIFYASCPLGAALEHRFWYCRAYQKVPRIRGITNVPILKSRHTYYSCWRYPFFTGVFEPLGNEPKRSFILDGIHWKDFLSIAHDGFEDVGDGDVVIISHSARSEIGR